MTTEQKIRAIMRRNVCPQCFKENFKPKGIYCIFMDNGDEDICDKAQEIKKCLKRRQVKSCKDCLRYSECFPKKNKQVYSK